MFSFFRKDPAKARQKKIEKLYESALQFQRNGKLREYAEVIAEIEKLNKDSSGHSASAN
ncbi:MAG: hypothetical protein HRU19_20860 [Pseudobacteriovorax sp.]|nr:hypothetical protein [Pseudobacteriovorax sp.]